MWVSAFREARALSKLAARARALLCSENNSESLNNEASAADLMHRLAGIAVGRVFFFGQDVG